MNWLDEVRGGLIGSWQLLVRDRQAYGYFNQTEAGFWRSFAAIILIAPLYLYAAGIEADLATSAGELADESVRSRSANLVALTLQWVLWPLVMVVIARYAGFQSNYAKYIIAYNWSSVVVIAIQVPPVLLFKAGIVTIGTAMTLLMIAFLAALYYRWYVARTALDCTGAAAAALVLADLVISIGANRLIG